MSEPTEPSTFPMKRCTNCRTTVPADSRYCWLCKGEKFEHFEGDQNLIDGKRIAENAQARPFGKPADPTTTNVVPVSPIEKNKIFIKPLLWSMALLFTLHVVFNAPGFILIYPFIIVLIVGYHMLSQIPSCENTILKFARIIFILICLYFLFGFASIVALFILCASQPPLV